MIPELADALHVDLETRSTVDLRQAGPYVYAEHWSTEVWVACFARGDGPVEVWCPGDPVPGLIAGAAAEQVPFVAHNVGFERIMFGKILGPRFGWPVPPLRQWWCTAAMAAALSLPRDLARAGEVLGLPVQKDGEGAKVMRAMMRPYRTERVPCWLCGAKSCSHPEQFRLNLFYREDPELVARGIEYCKRDVETERELCRHIRPLPPIEREVWLLDQLINERGVMVDLPAVGNAQKIVAEAMQELNDRAVELTGGYLATQAQKLKWWCNFEGVNLSDLRRETIRDLLLDDHTLDDNVRKALELRQEAAKTSTAKLTAFQRRACGDGRMRDNLMYHGASTGRWCLTGDHEVLTPDGWVRLDEWDGGSIAIWNPQEEISFQASRPVSFDYSGVMFVHESQRISQIATPEHKMPSWCMKTGNFEIREARDSGRWYLPFHGVRKHSAGLSADELRILVMVQADGHYTADGQIRLKFKKRRKIERCKTLLRRAGVIHCMHFERNDCVSFVISRRHMPTYLSMFRDKTFRGWLLDCDPVVFFDELEHWDAYRCGPRSIQYVTTNKVNAGMVQALAHTSGMAATIVMKRDRKPEWNDAYFVNIWLNPGRHHEVRYGPEQVQYDGKVYCAETPSGFFLVRRNGKVWVTGNSGRGAQLHNLPARFTLTKEQKVLGAELIRQGVSAEDIRWSVFDSPLEVVSASLRGMIIAGPGREFTVGDFNAIEARGTAWLAGAEGMLEAFRSGKDVYRRQAGLIYGLDPEEAQRLPRDGRERQIGKICLAGDVRVVTNRGVVPLVEVRAGDKLWDGIEWVTHDGRICQGHKTTVSVAGSRMTPDHLILAGQEWLSAESSACHETALCRALETAAALSTPSVIRWTTEEVLLQGPPGRTAAGCEPVYDLVNAGPRHRFTIVTNRGPLVVSNCVLGLGYQMGTEKFISTCWKERIPLSKPEAVHIVASYRDGNPEIPRLWGQLEDAAFEAVRYPERIVTVAGGRVAFARRGTWLYMRLPSGRLLSYAHPQIKKKRMPWLDQNTGMPAERWGVVYWGVDSVTHKWCEQNAYGGKWTENLCQALCRDLLVEAMLRLEAAGYPQVLSVHDEAVSEHDQGFGSVEEFQRLLCVTPDWAAGLPVEAEVWRGTRYRK